MATNSQMAAAYKKAANTMETCGWTRGTLGDGNSGFCAVGAIQVGADGDEALSMKMQEDFVDSAINKSIFVRFASKMDPTSQSDISYDGGLWTIEAWNDYAGYGKGRVLRRLRARQAYFEDLARTDRINELEELVSSLQAELARTRQMVLALVHRNNELEKEIGLLKRFTQKKLEREIYSRNTYLEQLDRDLDNAARELGALVS